MMTFFYKTSSGLFRKNHPEKIRTSKKSRLRKEGVEVYRMDLFLLFKK